MIMNVDLKEHELTLIYRWWMFYWKHAWKIVRKMRLWLESLCLKNSTNMRGEWEAKTCGADFFGTGAKDGRQILLRFREKVGSFHRYVHLQVSRIGYLRYYCKAKSRGYCSYN